MTHFGSNGFVLLVSFLLHARAFPQTYDAPMSASITRHSMSVDFYVMSIYIQLLLAPIHALGTEKVGERGAGLRLTSRPFCAQVCPSRRSILQHRQAAAVEEVSERKVEESEESRHARSAYVGSAVQSHW
jgi:hypothetical protein